ncbi:peptidyl-tRNA hydrolase [Echria macrotheca]|uniref:Peptidyl-tRNA hydrolase n=1 Tax=Echria macrotheca TaxID=438768 RepID=A0AAJ0BP82_9PEZI|nr:peptidyl-tRNA hydrolase [Echria macrotheca]
MNAPFRAAVRRTTFLRSSIPLLLRPTPSPTPSLAIQQKKTFTTTTSNPQKSLPPRPKPPPEGEIEEFFIKGTGPGGQKINKTNSAVQLRHIPTGIVVKCQATRSREQNRKTARELLAARLDELQNGNESRTAIVGTIKQKRYASAVKKARRKYRKLEEARTDNTDNTDNTLTG